MDPRAALDTDAVRTAYRRWAAIYDQSFGGVSAIARRRTVALVNELPGARVLEVGVGTGLALERYRRDKRITGIDLSAEMLARARARVKRLKLSNVDQLREMDAEATDFPDDTFDIAAAMFVASVVPHPRRLLAEMQRVVREGGHLLFVNHFAAAARPRAHWAGIPISPWRPCSGLRISLGSRASPCHHAGCSHWSNSPTDWRC
jgi:phosphatidylethanolamine/phosphatidyl-N-methylethanolamine N-methyltransferase